MEPSSGPSGFSKPKVSRTLPSHDAPTLPGASAHEGLAGRIGRVLVVGAGSMGGAIIRGLLGIPGMPPQSVAVADHHEDRLARLAERGCPTYPDAAAALAAGRADVVVLAIRPQGAEALAASLAASTVPGRPLLVSILSGVATTRLVELFGNAFEVVRAMPNTPMAVGVGMTLVASDAPAGPEAVSLAVDVFNAMGSAVAIPESLFDAGAAISGCGPAYFELIVDSLARAGVRHGLSRDVAQQLANGTMLGTAVLLAQTGKHPQAAIDEVTTPGGTTIAALEAMQEAGIVTAISKGVTAAVRRAEGER